MIIVLEGINGSGKSTVAKRLQARFAEENETAVLFRDPGSTPVGDQLRKIVRDPNLPLDPVSQVLLFTAARMQLIPTIKVHQDAEEAVILDRWWFSTYAYQASQGVDPAWIISLNLRVAHLPLNRCRCFFIDVLPETGMARLQNLPGGGFKDRFETKGLGFQRQLRERYLELCPGHLTRVDAQGKTVEDVTREVWLLIEATRQDA